MTWQRWHLLGSALVAASFCFVFGCCIICLVYPNAPLAARMASYCFFAIVYNVGFAIVQISHM